MTRPIEFHPVKVQRRTAAGVRLGIAFVLVTASACSTGAVVEHAKVTTSLNQTTTTPPISFLNRHSPAERSAREGAWRDAVRVPSSRDQAFVEAAVRALDAEELELDRPFTAKDVELDMRSAGLRSIRRELVELYRGKGGTLPLMCPAPADIDRTRTTASAKEHKALIVLFEHAAHDSDDPDLRAFAGRSLEVFTPSSGAGN